MTFFDSVEFIEQGQTSHFLLDIFLLQLEVQMLKRSGVLVFAAKELRIVVVLTTENVQRAVAAANTTASH